MGLAGGDLQAQTQGEVGGLAGNWVSRPGGSRPRPVGWGCIQHALRQTPPQQTATVVDGTHPTGMHSC